MVLRVWVCVCFTHRVLHFLASAIQWFVVHLRLPFCLARPLWLVASVAAAVTVVSVLPVWEQVGWGMKWRAALRMLLCVRRTQRERERERGGAQVLEGSVRRVWCCCMHADQLMSSSFLVYGIVVPHAHNQASCFCVTTGQHALRLLGAPVGRLVETVSVAMSTQEVTCMCVLRTNQPTDRSLSGVFPPCCGTHIYILLHTKHGNTCCLWYFLCAGLAVVACFSTVMLLYVPVSHTALAFTVSSSRDVCCGSFCARGGAGRHKPVVATRWVEGGGVGRLYAGRSCCCQGATIVDSTSSALCLWMGDLGDVRVPTQETTTINQPGRQRVWV